MTALSIHPVMNLSDFGIPSNGSPVSAQINAAISKMNAAGGGKLLGTPGGYYGVDVAGQDRQGKFYGVKMLPKVSLDFMGSTLLSKGTCALLSTTDDPWSTTIAHLTSDVVRGQTVFQVDSSTGFSTTDWQKVLFRGADSPIDNSETSCCIFAYAKATASNQITLDRPVNTAFAVSDVHGPDNKQIVLLSAPLENVSIGGCTIDGTSNGNNYATYGVRLNYAQNIRIHDIVGINPGPGLVVAQFCDTCEITNAQIKQSVEQNVQPWEGRGFTLSQVTNFLISRTKIENFQTYAVFTEFYSKNVKFRDLSVTNNFPGRNQNNALFFTGIGSQVDAENILLRGFGSKLSDSGGTDGVFSSSNLINDSATDWVAP